MTEIVAARFNNLQARIELILGSGAGQNGYGQTIQSGNVLTDGNTIIGANDLNDIYADMIRARIHQVGPGDIGIAEVLQNLNTVAEETSSQVTDQGVTQVDSDGDKKGIADFERLMTQIETDKFLVHSSQYDIEPTLSSVRTTVWSGLLVHEVQVNFTNEDERRYFFNTGGEIWFSGTNTSATEPKGLDWAELLAEVGTVKFGANATVATSGGGSAIGNYDLNGSNQVVYSKVGSGTYQQLYAGNTYTITARLDGGSRIIFRIEFNDIAIDNRIDNNVDGRLESVVRQVRATGDYVEVESPSYFSSSTLV